MNEEEAIRASVRTGKGCLGWAWAQTYQTWVG